MAAGLKGLTVLRGEKECRCCHQVLPLRLFRNDARGADGFAPRCRRCQAARQREYYRQVCRDPERHAAVLRRAKAFRDRKRAEAASATQEPQVPEGMKRCARCGRALALGQFYPTCNERSRDGLQGYCKACCRDYARERLKRIRSSTVLYARWLDKESTYRERRRKRRRENGNV